MNGISTPHTKRIFMPVAIDYTAIGLSGLCILHCLALPILAGALPLAATWAEAEWVHKAFVLLAIPVSGYAIFLKGAFSRDRIFVIFVTVGLALLIVSAFVESLTKFEQPLTSAGAFLVGSGHLWRWRRRYTSHLAGRDPSDTGHEHG